MLFQELNKLKRTSIIMSIILMAVGLIMVICPKSYTGTLVSALGYALLLAAIVMVLDYMNSKKVLINTVFLTVALIAALIGLSVLVYEEYIPRILGWFFGVLLVIQGSEQFYNAMMYIRPSGRQGWWILAAAAVCLVVVGAVVVYLGVTWTMDHPLLRVIGTALLIDASASILRLVLIWPIKAE